MGDWDASIATVGEAVLGRLAGMLDNPTCGWRQLANVVNGQRRFTCSDSEMTSCSLQVLSPNGSPARFMLARLAERSCSLALLLSCLKTLNHQQAVSYLTAYVMEQIQITVQPQSQQTPGGGRLVLTCRAKGPTGLSYQWFKGKEEILGGAGSAPELVLCPLSPAHQGHYICRVNHGEACTFSHWAQVRLVHSSSSPGCSSTLFPGAVSGLSVLVQPRSHNVSEGDPVVLECRAEANPPAQYQWYHNTQPLPEHRAGTLRIPDVTTAQRGQYSCRVFNLFHEMWSDTVQVNVGPSSGTDTDASWTDGHFSATDKVALLMGNMKYAHHTPLAAPLTDVYELASLLRQLDFKVVSLLDLDRQEMHSAVTEFLLLLDKGVYGLLYFAGHGYENYGSSFMVPVDAPAAYTWENCVCVQGVLQRMQEKQTGLNVFLLDMCRKRNLNDEAITQPGTLKVTANIVFGYATCVDAEAYEVKRDGLCNGIFISFLKKRLCEDRKVTAMLDKVAEDMGRCEITRGRQALELRSNLSERRSLTDPIQSSESPTSSSARNLQWAIAHVLPERRELHFDCGVTVQLGFAAEFSNIMIIYTRVVRQPPDVVACSAQLTDFPEGADVDVKKTNQNDLVEAGSLLLTMESLPAPEEPSLYTRLASLQRLRTELAFTVCLQYRYRHLEEDIQERQEISVGKPLVSKLNLHEPRLPLSSSTSSCCSASSSDLFSLCLPEARAFGGGAAAGANPPCYCPSLATGRPNMPEESLDFDTPQPE